MTDLINSIILGIVQGITEFLPVSSSGHLIIVRDILGIQVEYGLAFDAVLQLATTLAVLVYFWKDITGYINSFLKLVIGKKLQTEERTLLFAIILGTIPAVVFGFFLEDFMDNQFRSSALVAGSLIVGGIIMWLAERKAGRRAKQIERQSEKESEKESEDGENSLTIKKGFGIGLYQALALIPGFSRAGMSISGGLFLGLKREVATRFSFLLAFPVLAGSGLKKFLDLESSGLLNSVGMDLLWGSVTAFIVGLLAIHFLISYLKKHTLNAFVVYRFVVAGLILFFFL